MQPQQKNVAKISLIGIAVIVIIISLFFFIKSNISKPLTKMSSNKSTESVSTKDLTMDEVVDMLERRTRFFDSFTTTENIEALRAYLLLHISDQEFTSKYRTLTGEQLLEHAKFNSAIHHEVLNNLEKGLKWELKADGDRTELTVYDDNGDSTSISFFRVMGEWQW